MNCGVSTSCFYPMETVQSLAVLQKAGVKKGEIFLNTFSELEPPFVDRLEQQWAAGATQLCALHPFTSGMETFFFASMYPMRVDDGIALYRKYFSICQRLDIPRVVFHGDYKQTPFPFAKHCENYARLRAVASAYGIELCQENVVRCKCGTPDYIEKMRDILHDDVTFVLDVKQMRRAQVKLADMLKAMQGHISHVHISDETATCDCAVPGAGSFDFAALCKALIAQKFSGDMVIELYRGDFSDIETLCKSAQKLNEIFASVQRRSNE